MAKFLNTQGVAQWMLEIINSAEKELIIITPFLQLSKKIFEALREADKRKAEIVLIYRESKLNDTQREKLSLLENLNLMCHANVHAKCLFNGELLLVGSMNLYEYSEKNNREMGALFHKESIGDEKYWSIQSDDDHIFKEAIQEIRHIMTGSDMETSSIKTKSGKFELEIIKTDKEITEKKCAELNKHFGHKKFEAIPYYDEYEVRCQNYFDKIDVTIDYRVVFHFNFPIYHLNKMQQSFKPMHDEYMFDAFKFYWNDNGKQKAYLYPDSRHHFWKTDKTDLEKYSKIKGAIDGFIQCIKPFAVQK